MKEKIPDNHGMIRCDDEFEAVDQDLDMSTMGIVQGNRPYVMPDISRELALLDARLQESIKNKEDKHMLSIGTKVIVRTCDDYHGRHCGRVGTVCKHFAKDRRVGVMFDGIKNPASKDGFCAAVTKRMFGTTRNAMRALEKTSKTATPKKKETLPTTEG